MPEGVLVSLSDGSTRMLSASGLTFINFVLGKFEAGKSGPGALCWRLYEYLGDLSSLSSKKQRISPELMSGCGTPCFYKMRLGMADISKVSLFCTKTTLSENFDPGALAKVTTRPTFKIDIKFDESREKKFLKCPHCGRDIGYKSFRWEFNLRRALKWPLLMVGGGTILFFLTVFLMMSGWETEQAMWYFGMWGITAFVMGIIWLGIQVTRYLFFFRINKTRYVFSLLGTSHRLPSWRNGGSWRAPPTAIT